jgi:prepilin-type N-terminal cleavage/methylation domain-containing protein
MIQKQYRWRGGFTLLEIMIVVAVIALLAAIAVPNFLRARLRSQATACKQDLRMLDQAIQQYAAENNKRPTDAVAFVNLKAYIKENSPLYYGNGVDTLGNAFTFNTIADGVRVPDATKQATLDVTDTVFWSPYN